MSIAASSPCRTLLRPLHAPGLVDLGQIGQASGIHSLNRRSSSVHVRNHRLAEGRALSHWKFVDEFPTTVTGKIQKFKMREAAVAELGLQNVSRRQTA